MYKNILVAISHGSNSHDLFEIGLDLALKHNAQMTLCHIKNLQYIIPNYLNEGIYLPQDIVYLETVDGIEDILNKYKDEALNKGIKKVDIVVTASSTPALAITNVVAKGYDCDLIICGSSSSRGILKKIFGNVTTEIVKNAPCDVLVVKNFEKNIEEK